MRSSALAMFVLALFTAWLAVPHPAQAAKRSAVHAPTVGLVSPMRVTPGGTIVIRGRNFSSRRVRNTVVFRGRGAVLAKPAAAKRNRLVVKVPNRVHLLLAAHDGKAIPTRLRLRVVSRTHGRHRARISKRTGPNQSPLVVPRPGPEITSGPSGSTSDRSATLAFSSVKAASFTCRLDGGAWKQCASPTSYSDLELGDHRFSVRSHDAAGQTYASAATRSWTIVETPAPDAPDVEISSGPPATTNSTSATFAFSSTQPGSFECSIDLEAFSACSSPHSYSDVSPGAHELRVRVTKSLAERVPLTPKYLLPSGFFNRLRLTRGADTANHRVRESLHRVFGAPLASVTSIEAEKVPSRATLTRAKRLTPVVIGALAGEPNAGPEQRRLSTSIETFIRPGSERGVLNQICSLTPCWSCRETRRSLPRQARWPPR